MVFHVVGAVRRRFAVVFHAVGAVRCRFAVVFHAVGAVRRRFAVVFHAVGAVRRKHEIPPHPFGELPLSTGGAEPPLWLPLLKGELSEGLRESSFALIGR